MRILGECTCSGRGVMLMLLYTMLLLQSGCFLVNIESKRKVLWGKGLALCGLTGVALVLVRDLNERVLGRINKKLSAEEACLYFVPLWCVILFLGFLCAVTGILMQKTIEQYRLKLNRSAIKESFDNLPTGLSFSDQQGFVFLANRQIERLSFALTGTDLQDAEEFWRQIHTGKMQGVDNLKYGEHLCFRLNDQEIWTFKREFLKMENSEIVQITAVNIAEQFLLSESVKQNNALLSQMNQRLRQHWENMDEYVRNCEILDMKVRIHKEIGQALMASRVYLKQNAGGITEKELLKRWESVLLLMRKEAEPQEQQDNWKNFVDAAGKAGVMVLMDGEVSIEDLAKWQTELILMAAMEALTNAVRHAGADQLLIKISESRKQDLIVKFTNTGIKPRGNISEGGGLSGLRARLETRGCSMKIETEPQFQLTVVLPENEVESKIEYGI